MLVRDEVKDARESGGHDFVPDAGTRTDLSEGSPLPDSSLAAGATPVAHQGKKKVKAIKTVRILHEDIVRNEFWDARPELLDG